VARPWTPIEDQLLCAIVHEFGSNWGLITDVFAASAPFKVGPIITFHVIAMSLPCHRLSSSSLVFAACAAMRRSSQKCTCAPMPHSPPWPGHSLPDRLLIVYPYPVAASYSPPKTLATSSSSIILSHSVGPRVLSHMTSDDVATIWYATLVSGGVSARGAVQVAVPGAHAVSRRGGGSQRRGGVESQQGRVVQVAIYIKSVWVLRLMFVSLTLIPNALHMVSINQPPPPYDELRSIL
jgi:hypothetical protein